MKTWLITGCSGGFGKLLAEAALERGDNVVLTARDPAALKGLVERYPQSSRSQALDVCKPGDTARAVALAEDVFGSLDVLVNNAGYGVFGAIEEGTPEEYRPMFETNVFGLIETTRAALPILRKQRSGHIINFSSVAGLVGLPGQGYYNAAKFAVEGLSEALAGEVRLLGISVIIVEPGPFRTEFLGRSLTMARAKIADYAPTAGAVRAFRVNNDGKQVGDPAKAVAVILKAIDSELPPLHLPLGPRALQLTRNKIDALLSEMNAWDMEARATDFDAWGRPVAEVAFSRCVQAFGY